MRPLDDIINETKQLSFLASSLSPFKLFRQLWLSLLKLFSSVSLKQEEKGIEKQIENVQQGCSKEDFLMERSYRASTRPIQFSFDCNFGLV